MNTQTRVVDVGTDFTRFPAGRTLSDGPWCGEAFRTKYLVPGLDKNEHIIVKLDSALGYGSSFLEEAFGGLIRAGYAKDQVLQLVELDTSDETLRAEITGYIKAATKA